MHKRAMAAIFFLFFFAVAALAPLHVFSIETPRNGRLLYLRTVSPGDEFALSFIHSVENCPVRDHIRIDSGYRMVTYATEFWTSRTGLPYAPFGDEIFSAEGDHFRIGNMNRIIPEIYQWVDKKYENRLVFGDGKEIMLPDLAGDTLLKMSVTRVRLAQYAGMKLKLSIR
ncbi:MAG: DUF1850 domain-containing protein [Pseudomonadota bacterium]